MVASIALTVVVFFTVRFLASLGVKSAALCNAAGTGAVLLLLAGVWTGWVLFSTPPALPVATATAVPTAAPTPMLAPQIRASAAKGDQVLASIDEVTASPMPAHPAPANVFPVGATIFAQGWAASNRGVRLSRLVLVLDGRFVYDATSGYDVPRPDVAKTFAAPSMELTGFRGVGLPTNRLAPGTHTLQVGGFIDDSKLYYLAPTSVTFTLRKQSER